MPQVINTNMPSLNAQRNLNVTNATMSTAIQRLSTGLRVNSAKDDAAGLAIAERMNAQMRGMNVAIRNASDAISMAQVAEGGLGKVGDMAQRMRELAVQSANATNSDRDRQSLDEEYQQLAAEIERTLKITKFNGAPVLAGATDLQRFQVGAGTGDEDKIEVSSANVADMTEVSAVVSGTILTVDDSLQAMNDIDALVDVINSERAIWGAAQNRFEAVIANLQISSENQAAARGRIMDADYAAETAALTRTQILQQAGTAMLSQANQLPNSVLQLLR